LSVKHAKRKKRGGKNEKKDDKTKIPPSIVFYDPRKIMPPRVSRQADKGRGIKGEGRRKRGGEVGVWGGGR